ncbi:hypothetical protein GIB67_010627 [Kingdonia uniflora]|uniref:Mediator complex subunit 15 KIX domain-containing protein n=1 Tax=Kingdonia uniflora TaxID=39325 RepID=A0A7J7NTW8_9MAGN|nr:hypothetical protein GIB67_010627 [Kingdonia uniflora]
MDNNAPDWRTQLQDGSRQRIVNKIIESLKKHLPVSGHEGMQELMKIAERFEERIYTSGTTTSQSDYLRKISMKMLTMETKTQNVGVPNSNASGSNQNLPDTASHSMQTQVRNQGQPPVPLPNQSQGRQQLLSQSMQNTIAPAGVQSSSGLMSALPSVTGLSQPSMLNTVSQSSNLQDILGISQNSVSNNAGQGIPSNILASSQKQMQGRPHPHQVLTSQHQQSMHMLQQQGKGAGQQQQAPQTSSTLLQPLQGQQQSQSQMVSQLQPSQIQQQLGLQQQSNSLHRDVQQRPSMQTQSVIDQKPVFHSQRVLPEASSTSIDSTAQTGHASGADWQEETYQKIKTMKDMYLPDLSDMHHKISISFQQSENLQAPKGQIEQLRVFKSMLERMVQFLQLSKHQIRLSYREKINQIEKQIVGILTTHRPKKPNSLQLQQQNQQQLPPPNDLQMNLQQENQTNPQMQTTNLQANMMNSLQTGSMLESGQGNTMGSLNQGGMGFLQQNAVGASQQANTNTLSQSNVNVNPLQLFLAVFSITI